MNWRKGLKIRIKFQEPMKKHTAFNIGGPAEYFVEPKDTHELKLLLNSVKRCNIPILVIGAGSNILIKDNGLKAIVLRLDSPVFNKVSFCGRHIYAASGVPLSRLIGLAQRKGLSGLEFLTGIPGTLGGALAMNAGISGKNIAELVESVEVMDYKGNIKNLNKRKIKFSYRRSSLTHYIILGARLKLLKKDSREIREEIGRRIDYRRSTQDYSFASAGCIFKNPKGAQAGRLIDLCGLKGKRIGDARISLRHANFILNLGQAKAGDVLRLIKLAREKVKDKFGITLEPEIKIWQ